MSSARMSNTKGMSWNAVVDDIRVLDKLHTVIQSWHSANNILVDISEYYWFEKTMLKWWEGMVDPNGSVLFSLWLSKQSWKLHREITSTAGKVCDEINRMYAPLHKLQQGVVDRSEEVQLEDKIEWHLASVRKHMDNLISDVSDIMRAAGPESYTYEGFRIYNPHRFMDDTLQLLHDSVDSIVALFKKRGVTPLLRESLERIDFAWNANYEMSNGGTPAGSYYSNYKKIIIYANQVLDYNQSSSRAEIRGVFLHELAHHIHLDYLHPDAKKTWDSGWAGVEEARYKSEIDLKVTYAERWTFFDLLSDSSWDVKAAFTKLKGIDRLKYRHWLSYQWGSSTITKSYHQLRLTEYGERALHFLKYPDFAREEYLEAYSGDEEGANRRFDKFMRLVMSNLGLSDSYQNVSSMLPKDVVDKIKSKRDSDPVADAISKLEIPTEYGKTDDMEDFAETFVLFMREPDKLSEQAMSRMQRALATSGLYGKPVMRVAQIEKKHWLFK